MGRRYPTELAIVADAALTLRALLERVQRRGAARALERSAEVAGVRAQLAAPRTRALLATCPTCRHCATACSATQSCATT